MPFQTTVKTDPAPAVAGDFASNNPYWNVLAGPGQLIAGAAGLTVGRFAWYDDATYTTTANTGIGAPDGFVHRDLMGMITTYLAETSMLIPSGWPVSLFSAGDFWVVNSGSNAAVPGMKAYALYASGLVQFAATGTPPQLGSTTGAIAASTFSTTGSIADTIMTITAVGSGTVVAGATISGTNVVTGTKVVSQISGTTGGIGTYRVTIPQTVASTTISGTYGTLTVTVVGSGSLAVGSVLAGTNVTAGSIITQLGTGTGGTGTYIVDPTQTAASATVTGTAGIETKWYAMSAGLPGELVKMSSQPLG